jgi:hypothetical protein
MGDGGFSIDLGSALPYVVDSVLGFFGKDAASRDWKNKLNQLTKLSFQEASNVQCVGMPQPIPIQNIYQRTTICAPPRGNNIELDTLLQQNQDAVIMAGPGWGKTTLLHWTYMRLVKSGRFLPLLFTLRWHDAIEDLENLVAELQRGNLAARKDQRLVLLVDGYDEIEEPQRRRVSRALVLFSSLATGNFFLTCRSHYPVLDLKCRHFELAPFSKSDSCQFVNAYSRAFGDKVDGEKLIDELEKHHLGEFARHPLMLTLVCILKSGPNQEVPRRAIGLLRRAIDTLAFRWDEAKGIHRQSTIPLDGEERIRVLMRIAFDMNKPQVSWETVQKSAASHLQLLQVKNVSVRDLLHEMARFYGVLVPVGEEFWQFAHRTVHDYLSARYWVESGRFDPTKVHDWDMHAAYAASLTADATEPMVRMLHRSKNVIAFTECMYNMAPFDAERVAHAVIERVGGFTPPFSVRATGNISREGDLLRVEHGDDFYSVCSDEFLRALIRQAATLDELQDIYQGSAAEKGAGIAAVSAMAELLVRGAKIRPKHAALFWTAVGDPKPATLQCVLPGKTITFTAEQLLAATIAQEPPRFDIVSITPQV